ncbi:MAG: UDP-3-O-[Bacteroidales bacterium]|nr:UDP-3-O-[3-hydroxymyristoyl] N-acetylglucosamine deacetylase [Bacteroidales bacterium]
MKQHTLKASCSFSGKGLHTGRPVSMQVLPSSPGTGIVFQRTDLPGEPMVAAHVRNVGRTRRGTTLSSAGVRILTPEHLLSALSCLGVDNALVRLDAAEVPILDGSARPYAEAFIACGLEEQPEERVPLAVRRPFVYEDPRSGARIGLEPFDGFEAEVTIDFKSKVIGVQKARFDASTDYVRDIAPCRTFCFRREVFFLRLTGLIRGGSLENALVVDEPRGYVGNPVLSFENEPARHKLLDLLGDFSLAGRPILGRVRAYKPGHTVNTKALALFLSENGYE